MLRHARATMRHRSAWLKLLLLTANLTPASGLAELRLAPRLRRATPHRMTPARLPTQQQPRCSAMLTVDPKLLAVSLGGVFAGGLHSVTGPDHLAALLPICIGKRWCDPPQSPDPQLDRGSWASGARGGGGRLELDGVGEACQRPVAGQ